MAKTLTLEEAAQKLGLSTDEFKTNLKTHEDFRAVRPLMGGATMHFRAQDIDELARRLGLGSEPELQLGDATTEAGSAMKEGDDQIEIGRDLVRGSGTSSQRLQPPSSKKISASKPAEDAPLQLQGSSEEFIPLAEDKGGKPDSGAKVKTSSDSDVRIEKKDPNRPSRVSKAGEVFELAKDSGRAGSKAPSGKAPSSKTSASKKPADSSSEFELKLGADSSDEFELTLADEGSDEIDLAKIPRDATGSKGKSGVNLKNPADSGISLESKSRKKGPDSDSEFELNLDSSKTSKVSGPKSSGRKKKPDSDSEFELTLDDSSEIATPSKRMKDGDKDIFETDFDIPALDDESASEAVVLEETDTDLESSDFDLALDESGVVEESASEVVELDESTEAPPSGRRRAVAAVDEEGPSAAEELAGVEEEEGAVAVAPAGPQQKAKWGPLPAFVLAPCLLVMFFVGIMGFELMRSMWGFHQAANKPSATLTRGIAGIFIGENELPKD